MLCCVVGMGIALGCPSLGAQEAQQVVDGGAPRTIAEDATPQNSAAAGGTERDVSWGTLPRNFLQDQKDIWLFPVRLAKGWDRLPALAVTSATAALIVADSHDTRYFRRTARFEGFNDAFSGSITAGEMAAVPAAFLIVGHFRHDSYAEKTALLAGEAYADSAIVDIVMKMATRRLRPVCGGDDVRASLPAVSLGAMGGVRGGFGYQLFAGYNAGALSFGCVPGGGAGVYD